MAGNIVKWWKHKILGGYKQFSVQECTTDSEELVQQQIRASSSCSAPPDLLLVSEREHCLSQRAAASTSEANLNGNHMQRQHHHHSHSQHQHNNHPQQQLNTTNSTKEATTSKHNKNDFLSTKCKTSKLIDIDTATEDNNDNAASRHEQSLMPEQTDCVGYEKERDEQLHFEEFTCDVSVEGGKSSKPLQFSFTFYDLDGHHGKITKDDIVGIVYTIYESIGKSVVVPHYGSKTINVRLTFSPESKSKAATGTTNNNGDVLDGKLSTHVQTTATTSGKVNARRQHRYRPRKLIKSEDEEDDSQSDKEKDNNNVCTIAGPAHKKHSKHIGKAKLYERSQQKQLNNEHSITHSYSQSQTHSAPTHTYNNTHTQSINNDSIYDNINLENLKCCATHKEAAANMHTTNTAPILEACSGCGTKLDNAAIRQRPAEHSAASKPAAATRVKVLRKTRKQKQQDQQCAEHRQRSLSVGNEICYKNRHLTHQQQHQLLQHQQQQQISKQTQTFDKIEDNTTTIDGVQLRNPPKEATALRYTKRNSSECWKSALNRNDLISIIRESMEKNRLCFQLNEKPQANVTPIRQTQQQRASLQNSQQHSQLPQQRLRANTASKIPTLIAHHSNSCLNNINNNNNTNNNSSNNNNNNNNNNEEPHLEQAQNHSSHASLCQLQPHIPIYHQHMAINPAVVAAQNNLNGHNKMNPCGYDSFLHATICAGGRNAAYSPTATPLPPTTPTAMAMPTAAAAILLQQQQPIAAVQPILNVPTSMPHEVKSANASTHQIKLSKILRSGAYSQHYQQYHSNVTNNTTVSAAANTAQNSPQYRGYQRLASQHNLPPLHLQSANMTDGKPHVEKRAHSRDRCARSKQSQKHNESLLYAKLREDLQENIFNATGGLGAEHKAKEQPYRKHAAYKLARHAKQHNCAKAQQLAEAAEHSAKPDYISMLAMNGVDAIECENLLDEQTSDEEELLSEVNTPNVERDEKLIIHESEDTLPTPTSATNNIITANTANTNVTTSQNSESLINLNDDDDDDDADCKLDTVLTPADEAEVDEDEDLEEDVDVDVDVEDEDEPEHELDIEAIDADLMANNNNSHLSPTGSRAALTTTASAAANTNNGSNTSATSASSLIHRCVHEHIHHHYHHFEKKDE